MTRSLDQEGRDRPSAAGDAPVARSRPHIVVGRLGDAPALLPDPGEACTCRVVTSVAALRAAVPKDRPDGLIVMGTPGSGLPAVAELRADPAAARLPVLVISPVDDADDRLQAYEAGANDYIVAPISARELAARIAAAGGPGRARAGDEQPRPFLERVLSGIDDALVVLDCDWCYRFANERVAELTGVPREALLGREIWSVFPGLAQTRFAGAARGAMDRREVRRARFEYPPLGVVFDTRIYPSEEGITIFARDVTEAARARAAVEASEARFRALAGSVEEVFWIFDGERYAYEYVSPAVETVFGVKPEALHADPDLPRTLLADARDWMPFAAPRTGGDPHRRLRFRIRRPDGAVRWIESRSYPFDHGAADAARRICGISRDVTAEVALEQRLAADRDEQSERALDLERRFRLLIEGTREYAIYMLDTEGWITTWNEGAQRLTGYNEAEVRGRHFSILFTGTDHSRDRPAELLARARECGSAEEEGWRVRRDGSRFRASATLTAVRDEAGRLEGFGKVLRDLSERYEAERQRVALLEDLEARRNELEAANRSLETYGRRLQELSGRVQAIQETERRQVARDLHDDIAQRITALRMLLNNVEAPVGAADDAVREAREQLDELLTAVRDLMADLHPSELDDLGLVPALRRLGRRLAAAWEIPVTIRGDGGASGRGSERVVAGYRIAQEAIGNALRHSGCSGVEVRVATHGEDLLVTVRDDGCGFDPGAEPAQGGIGLLGMRERAAFRGGSVAIDSAPGAGTAVTVRLPPSAGARAGDGDFPRYA